MDIRVIFRENSAGVVPDHRLEEMINSGDIVAFWRNGEWINVNGGPIRNNSENFTRKEGRRLGSSS